MERESLSGLGQALGPSEWSPAEKLRRRYTVWRSHNTQAKEASIVFRVIHHGKLSRTPCMLHQKKQRRGFLCSTSPFLFCGRAFRLYEVPKTRADPAHYRQRRGCAPSCLTEDDHRKISRTVAHALFPIRFVSDEEFAPPVRGFPSGKSCCGSPEERSIFESPWASGFGRVPAAASPFGRSRPPQPTTFIPPNSPMISPLHTAQFFKETAPAPAVVG